MRRNTLALCLLACLGGTLMNATSYSVSYPFDRSRNKWPTITVKGRSVTVYRMVESNNCAKATGVLLFGVGKDAGKVYRRNGTGKLTIEPGQYSHRTLGRAAILSPCRKERTYFGSHITYSE
jgi:hypothetical protein